MGLSVGFKSFFLGIIVTSLVWSCIMYVYLHSDGSPKIYRRRIVPRYKPVVVDDNPVSFAKAKGKKYDFRESNMVQDDPDVNELPHDLGAAASDLNLVLNSSDLLTLGVIRTPVDQRVKDGGYQRHAFNLLISNRLGYHRPIPDTRNALCKSQTYSQMLPSTSVIICFYNEALSTLLRTVHSVLDRTPKQLLHEIILVNDQSNDNALMSKLARYTATHFPPEVKLIKTPERAGLIRARLFGARQATGEVLLFLDSHCEVNVGWLEPLLDRIKGNRSRVVCPIIDIINSDAFEYSSSPLVKGGFNWGLHFKWDSIPQLTKAEDYIKPVRSPTMAGGLFAIDRNYFKKLGEYDEGMNIWGGENLELSFRIWMCGGTLEIIPCSRVGHVFRKRRPYGSPDGEDTLTHNSLRVVHVWLDEYKDAFFALRPDARDKPYGDVSERIALRKRLNCSSFDWYLKTVYPEMKLPSDKQSQVKSNIPALQKQFQGRVDAWHRTPPPVVEKYQIQLSGTKLCIESEEEVTTKGSLLVLQRCIRIKKQTWYETEKHDLRLANLLCLDAGEKYPRLHKCHEMGSHQDWRHSKKRNSPFYNPSAGLCLGAPSHNVGDHVTLEVCDSPQAAKWNIRT